MSEQLIGVDTGGTFTDLVALGREGLAVEQLEDDQIYEVFEAFAKGRIPRESIAPILKDVIMTGCDVGAAVDGYLLVPMSNEELSELIAARVEARKADWKDIPKEAAFRLLMGDVMRSSPKLLDPGRVSELLREALVAGQ